VADVVFLAIVIAFFALCGLLVSACDRLVGRDGQVAEPAEARVRARAGVGS